MKKILVSILMIFPFIGVHAQLEGSSSVHVGYGFGNIVQSVLALDYQGYDDYKYTGTGPLFLKYEYGVNDKITMGVNIAHVAADVSYKNNGHLVGGLIPFEESISWESTSFLARLNFHFGSNNRFDPYWGFGFGYRVSKWTYENNDPTYEAPDEVGTIFPLGFEASIGARYYFTNNIGIYGEAGLAKAVLQFGVSGRF